MVIKKEDDTETRAYAADTEARRSHSLLLLCLLVTRKKHGVSAIVARMDGVWTHLTGAHVLRIPLFESSSRS